MKSPFLCLKLIYNNKFNIIIAIYNIFFLFFLLQMWSFQIILLTAVALSSSNVILNLPDTNHRLRGQYNDNIYLNDNREINNIVCSDLIDALALCKLLELKNYINGDNNKIRKESLNDIVIEKDINYNGKGFRKEQWHNYPRQLDRLQNFLYEHHKPDYGDKNGISEKESRIKHEIPSHNRDVRNDIKGIEIPTVDLNKDDLDTTGVRINPLFILKIQLARLNSVITNKNRNNILGKEINVENNANILDKIIMKTQNRNNPRTDEPAPNIGSRYWQSSQEISNNFGKKFYNNLFLML